MLDAADAPTPRALLFDVFGTLVDWRGPVARELESVFAPRGEARDWDGLARFWRRLYQPAMEEIRSGRRGFVPLDVLHRENLQRMLEEHRLQASPDEIAHLTRAWHRLAPWPDTVAGMQALRPRFVLAACSNGNVALMVNLARHAGLPFDMILGAEIAGAYKPDPRAYMESARLLDLAPGECLMVAAHASDLEAARALGFRTAYLHRPEEYGTGPAAAPPGPWDVSVGDLPALARAL